MSGLRHPFERLTEHRAKQLQRERRARYARRLARALAVVLFTAGLALTVRIGRELVPVTQLSETQSVGWSVALYLGIMVLGAFLARILPRPPPKRVRLLKHRIDWSEQA